MHFTLRSARLPEDPKAFEDLAADVNAKREVWREAIQTETWAIQKVVSYAGMKPEDFSRFYRNASPIRKIYISFVQSFEQADCSRFVSGAADQIAISERLRDLALADLGAGGDEPNLLALCPDSNKHSEFRIIFRCFSPELVALLDSLERDIAAARAGGVDSLGANTSADGQIWESRRNGIRRNPRCQMADYW